MYRSATQRMILVLIPVLFAIHADIAAAAQPDDDIDQGWRRKPEDGWDVTLGGGGASLPKYPGSDEQKTRALPIVDVRYGRFFLGGDSGPGGSGPGGGLGMNFYEDERWRIGAAISAGAFKARNERDDARLRGLGDIDGTTRLATFAGYSSGWFGADVSVSRDVGGNKQGLVAELDLSASWPVSRKFLISAGPSVTWANGEHMQTFYGIDAQQSARSGRPQYRAGSGVASVGFSASARYRIDAHWGLGAFVSTSQLQGDAKDSPIVQDRTQNVFGVFTTYHF